jgi:hypothetical protein
MPSLNFEVEKTSFRNYYTDSYALLKDAEEFIRSLITSLLSQASDAHLSTRRGTTPEAYILAANRDIAA